MHLDASGAKSKKTAGYLKIWPMNVHYGGDGAPKIHQKRSLQSRDGIRFDRNGNRWGCALALFSLFDTGSCKGQSALIQSKGCVNYYLGSVRSEINFQQHHRVVLH